jgi:3'-5' exoribonuclease
MTLLTIRELKTRAGSQPLEAAVRAQIDSIQSKSAKSGNEYLELRLADAEDGLILRLWSDGAGFAAARRLLAKAFVEVCGEWTQNQFGVDARNPRLRELSAVEGSELIGGPAAMREKQAADWAFIGETCAALADPRLRAVCARFLDEYGERFRRTGAAREYHHARRGGLVEHVAQMMRSALAVCAAYPSLNSDLLITGVLFHDCGKLWENCYAPNGFLMPYTDAGELLGHISIGIELVNSLWRTLVENEMSAAWQTLQPTTEEVKLHLLHLIASHHGEMQFGSPVWPKTPEAIVLHHLDNIDAKLEMMADGYATSTALGRNIFERRRPLPANLVRPLPTFASIGDVPAPTAGEPAEEMPPTDTTEKTES